jgi:hypothetical protein
VTPFFLFLVSFSCSSLFSAAFLSLVLLTAYKTHNQLLRSRSHSRGPSRKSTNSSIFKAPLNVTTPQRLVYYEFSISILNFCFLNLHCFSFHFREGTFCSLPSLGCMLSTVVQYSLHHHAAQEPPLACSNTRATRKR